MHEITTNEDDGGKLLDVTMCLKHVDRGDVS